MTYVVEPGDNWYNIALRFGVSQEALAAANDSTPSDILQVDDKLVIPAAEVTATRSSQPTPTARASAAPKTASATPQVYAVQRGDNWYTIARRFGVTQEALAAYNGRSSADILQVNQKLRIPPIGGAVPTLTPTRVVKPSPTQTSEPAAPIEPTEVVNLPAPVLLAPMDGDGFNAESLPVLTWRPVPGLTDLDAYYVRVNFTTLDGGTGYVDDIVTDTSFTVPQWVFDAAQPPDRISSWSVQVIRRDPSGEAVRISSPSETRAYYWR